jgi:hypothetical protein
MTKQSKEPKYQLVALKDATHVKINGVIHKITRYCPDLFSYTDLSFYDNFRREIQTILHKDEVRILTFPSGSNSILILKGTVAFEYIDSYLFSVLGIECLREVPPLEHEKTVVSLDHQKNEGVILYLPKEAIGKKFKLIEIRDEK